MTTRLNKKNETVTITLNADELWTLRCACFETRDEFLRDGLNNLASEFESFINETDVAFNYLTREW